VLLLPDYLRRVDPSVVTLLTPYVWHPNVSGPAICLGRMRPATPINDLVIQIVEILTYLNYTPIEHDSLNRDACQWARNHTDRFPLERRGIHLPSQFIA
jgi:ubiquitin-protein ligase